MSNSLSSAWTETNAPWLTFEAMLHRLHTEGIYLHPDQLAEFLLYHGLPVNLSYVPDRLRQKAIQVNTHYKGDMARLEFE